MNKLVFISPEVEIMDLPMQEVICGSPGTENMEQPGGNGDPDIPWS